jgi:hypothetical protein
MFDQMDVPILGIIENMSGLRCPHCGEMIEIFKRGGGARASKELGLDFLGEIPIDPEIVRLGDMGVPFVRSTTAAKESFERIASRIMEKISPKESVDKSLHPGV